MKKRWFISGVIAMTLMTLATSCGSPANKTALTTTAYTSPTATPTATTTTTKTGLPTSTLTTTPTTAENNDVAFASTMANFFYDINTVRNYYDDGVTAMSSFDAGAGTATVSAKQTSGILLASYKATSYEDLKNKIPTEFSNKLPSSGSMPAPAGACPAAAEPNASFVTKNGDTVTPALIAQKGISTIPTSLINAPLDSSGSLLSMMQQWVPQNDIRLGEAAGWNTLLWDRLKALQTPAESLMDYQMWNTSGEMEQELVTKFRQSLVDKGVPQRVLDAYDASNKTGWYASVQPTAKDALARMEIVAKLTGSVNGTVHEHRDFSISHLGQTPTFGVQTGEGTVNFTLPVIGEVESSVDIHLDQFDELGRAIGGTVTALPIEHDGYKVIFTYKPDGSKEGQVFDPSGEVVGELTMTVDAEKFENYVSVKKGTTIKLPEYTGTPAS